MSHLAQRIDRVLGLVVVSLLLGSVIAMGTAFALLT